jgi:dynein heavy chain
MNQLIQRVNQYDNWIKNGEPACTWLSGIQVPYSYMIALSQQYCKENKYELDKLTIDTKVTKFTDSSKITTKPANGRYISGLFIEGARFDMETMMLDYQQPKVLI